MNNPNSFGYGTESGYGYNDNGTEMSRDDYRADNPYMAGDAYEENIRLAEQEEENEIRNLYPGEYDYKKPESQTEALRNAIQIIKEAIAHAEEVLNRQEVPTDKQAVGEKAIDAVNMGTVSDEKSGNNEAIDQTAVANAAGAQAADRYVDSKGIVHSSLESLRDAENGYK